MEQNIEGESIIIIPDSELYEITNNYEKKLLQKSQFQIIHLQQLNLHMICLGDFKYFLKKEIPIMTNTNENAQIQRIYILPYIQKYMAIKLPLIVEKELVDCVDVILSDQAHLICNASKEDLDDIEKEDLSQINMRQSVILRYQEENFEETINDDEQKVEAVKNAQPQSKEQLKLSQKIANVLNKGGNIIRDQMILGANKLAPYIQKGTDYLKTKIKKNEKETEVKSAYNTGAKVANTTSKAAVIYTKAQIEGLMQIAKTIGNDVVKEVESSKTGQKVVQHKNYEDAKRVGKATLHAGLNVYDGLYSVFYYLIQKKKALAIIGTSLGDATCDLLQHKYGEQVGKVAKDGVQIVENVGSLGRVYKNVIVKTGQDLSKQSQIKQN